MKTMVEVMDGFDAAVGDSARDSIEKIKRLFALAQTELGWDAALEALAMTLIIAEQRRRALEAVALRSSADHLADADELIGKTA